jgi:flavin-dependent thymidylate synthase
MGGDDMICKAARVSTLGAESLETQESAGLINFLMKNRHGSPFEHGSMTFRISAPIFVWREFMRHRIGFSYNEESGRYKVLDPVFYVPARKFWNSDRNEWIPGRHLIQVGKPGHYEFEQGTDGQEVAVYNSLVESYSQAWRSYQHMLNMNIAKEVARMCLPVAIYSTAYVTCNPRSLMSFLSLRTKNDLSMFPSYPQWEIEEVARNMEELFADKFPITHGAFMTNGRVSP